MCEIGANLLRAPKRRGGCCERKNAVMCYVSRLGCSEKCGATGSDFKKCGAVNKCISERSGNSRKLTHLR